MPRDYSSLMPITRHPLALETYEDYFHFPYAMPGTGSGGAFTRVGNVVVFYGASKFQRGDHNMDKCMETIPFGFRPVSYATALISSSGAFYCIDSNGNIYITGYMGQPSEQYSSVMGVWLTTDAPPGGRAYIPNLNGINPKAYYKSCEYRTSTTSIHFPYLGDDARMTICRVGNFVYAGGWGYGSFPERHWHTINETIPLGYRPANSNMGMINVSALAGSLYVKTDGSIQSDGFARSNKWFMANGLWVTKDPFQY